MKRCENCGADAEQTQPHDVGCPKHHLSRRIRVAIKSPRKHGDPRPAYGKQNANGSFTEDDGTTHPAGSWYPSRQADGNEDEE